MANPRAWEEQALQCFGTREAMLDFLLATKYIDYVKKKFMNIFMCFRKISAVVLRPSLSGMLQHELSKVIGAIWNEEKTQNPGFWVDLHRDFVAGHKARFPYYWQKMKELAAMSPEERKAELDRQPDPPGQRRKKKRDTTVEEKLSRRARAAPYTVPGSSSSSSRSRFSRSPASSSPSTISQGSPEAVPLVPIPPAVADHHSAPLPVPVYPSNQPSLPVYPSAQPSNTMMAPADPYSGLQTPPHAQYYGNAPLNGGQHMATPVRPAPVAVPQPPSLGIGTQAQIHAAQWANTNALPAGAYHRTMTTTMTHSASWPRNATTPGPAVLYYRQPGPVNSAVAAPPAVPYRETGLSYETYQGATGDYLPAQSVAAVPSYQTPGLTFPSHLWPSPEVAGLAGFPPVPPETWF